MAKAAPTTNPTQSRSAVREVVMWVEGGARRESKGRCSTKAGCPLGLTHTPLSVQEHRRVHMHAHTKAQLSLHVHTHVCRRVSRGTCRHSFDRCLEHLSGQIDLSLCILIICTMIRTMFLVCIDEDLRTSV